MMANINFYSLEMLVILENIAENHCTLIFLYKKIRYDMAVVNVEQKCKVT